MYPSELAVDSGVGTDRVQSFLEGAAEPTADEFRSMDAAMRECDEEARTSILQEAEAAAIERGKSYGPPDQNMRAIARLWTAYLQTHAEQNGGEVDLSPVDVAMMMTDVKKARHQTGSGSRDNFVDMAGYARVASEVDE
jgi:hypothetical protein